MTGIWTLLLALSAAAAPQRLPELTLHDLNGQAHTLSELAPSGALLLDFWATWCTPCRAAFPHYARFAKSYADRGLVVWTVSEDQPAQQKRIAPLLEKLGVSLPVLLDPEGELSEAMGVLNLPTTLLFDASGQVVYRHVGFLPGDEREIEAQLRTVLGPPEAKESASDELAAPPQPR